MFYHSAALVAVAVALSLYVHWADKLSSFLGAAMLIVTLGLNSNVHPLIVALVLFTTSLVLLLAFMASSRLFVFSVVLPSLLATYTGNCWWALWAGLSVYYFWMDGLRGVLYLPFQFFVVEWLKASSSPVPNQRKFWSLILRPFNLKSYRITSSIHAYQIHIHPALLLLSQCLFLVVDKVVYNTTQFVKWVVWEFRGGYDWCPDWKIEEHARQSAEYQAQKLREKIPPEVARRQREESQRKWHQHELERESRNKAGSVEPSYKGLRHERSFIDYSPPSTDSSPNFFRMIEEMMKIPSSSQNGSDQMESPSSESPTPTAPVSSHQAPVPPTVPAESPMNHFSQPPIQRLPSTPIAPFQNTHEGPKNHNSAQVSDTTQFIITPARTSKYPEKRVRFELPVKEAKKPASGTSGKQMEHEMNKPTEHYGTSNTQIDYQMDEPIDCDMDEPMEDEDVVMTDRMDEVEELISLMEGLKITSKCDEDLMDIDCQPPALSWIIGEAPFVPLYSHVSHASVSHPARNVHPLDSFTSPAIADFSAVPAVYAPSFPAPEPAPRAMPIAPMYPAEVPPAGFTAPTGPAATSHTFSAPLPLPAPVYESSTIAPATTFTSSARPVHPPQQYPDTFVPPAVPASSGFNFDFSGPSFPAPSMAPPAVSSFQTAPTGSIFNFTGAAESPMPDIDEELENQLLAEFGALSPTPEKQPTPSFSEQPTGVFRSSQDAEWASSGPRPSFEAQPIPSYPQPTEPFRSSQDAEWASSGPRPSFEEQPIPSYPEPTEPFRLSQDDEAELFGPLPGSEEQFIPSPEPTEPFRLSQDDEAELFGPSPEQPYSYPPPETQNRAWSSWTPQDKADLDAALFGTGEEIDMGIGHRPGTPPMYADDPKDIEKAKYYPDPNPRGGKRRG
ncbi:hypothetical protein F4824DRAFT_499631 [Ustulina deusta]|nr:hypothetical protein F4824DRAFT_499631 [Ustulina deusta]